jgi:hypothetical protein
VSQPGGYYCADEHACKARMHAPPAQACPCPSCPHPVISYTLICYCADEHDCKTRMHAPLLKRAHTPCLCPHPVSQS